MIVFYHDSTDTDTKSAISDFKTSYFHHWSPRFDLSVGIIFVFSIAYSGQIPGICFKTCMFVSFHILSKSMSINWNAIRPCVVSSSRPQIFYIFKSHLKIHGHKKAKRSKFLTEGPTNSGHHRIKFSSSSDLEPGICTSLWPSITYLQHR